MIQGSRKHPYPSKFCPKDFITREHFAVTSISATRDSCCIFGTMMRQGKPSMLLSEILHKMVSGENFMQVNQRPSYTSSFQWAHHCKGTLIKATENFPRICLPEKGQYNMTSSRLPHRHHEGDSNSMVPCVAGPRCNIPGQTPCAPHKHCTSLVGAQDTCIVSTVYRIRQQRTT